MDNLTRIDEGHLHRINQVSYFTPVKSSVTTAERVDGKIRLVHVTCYASSESVFCPILWTAHTIAIGHSCYSFIASVEPINTESLTSNPAGQFHLSLKYIARERRVGSRSRFNDIRVDALGI